MLAWLVLLVLLTAEVGGLRWWLRRQYHPVFFNGWAALIYSCVLAADFVVTWLVSILQTPGGTYGTALLAVLGVALVAIVFLGTLFFRWVVAHDMTDIRK